MPIFQGGKNKYKENKFKMGVFKDWVVWVMDETILLKAFDWAYTWSGGAFQTSSCHKTDWDSLWHFIQVRIQNFLTDKARENAKV